MRILIYLACIALCLLLAAIYDLYGAFLLAVMLVLIPLLSLALAAWGKRLVELSSPTLSAVTHGTPAEIPLTATGRALPFLASLSAEAGSESAERWEPVKSGVRFFCPLAAPHVGRVQLPAPRLTFTDPFGFHHFHVDGAPLSLLVLPKRIGNPGKTWHTLLSLMNGNEVERFGATPYTPGDSPRLINWKVTARKDDLYVRDVYPAESTRLVLACDYGMEGDERDLLCDALYACGLALTEHHEPFLFAWAHERAGSIVSPIRSRGEWEEAVKQFLSHGRNGALARAALPTDAAVLYLTAEAAPRMAAPLRPVIWCARENPRAARSGRAAILAALGGGA